MDIAIAPCLASSDFVWCAGICGDFHLLATCVLTTVAPADASDLAEPTRNECPEMNPSTLASVERFCVIRRADCSWILFFMNMSTAPYLFAQCPELPARSFVASVAGIAKYTPKDENISKVNILKILVVSFSPFSMPVQLSKLHIDQLTKSKVCSFNN